MSLTKSFSVTAAGIVAMALFLAATLAAVGAPRHALAQAVGTPVGVTVFYGSVVLNGSAAPAGTTVSVILGGNTIGSAKTGDNGQASDGYRIDVQALASYEGQPASVQVTGAGPATTVTFHVAFAIKSDLSVTTSAATAVPSTPTPVPPTATPVKACPGDTNNDRVVDSKDLARLSAAYGTKRGDATFDATADLYPDAVIDIRDLATLGANYGNAC